MKAHKRHEQFREVMHEAGARLINECNGPETHPQTSVIQFWGVPGKGTLLAQLWSEGGVSTYAGWGMGETWDHLRGVLKGDREALETDLLNACKKASAFLQCDVKTSLSPDTRMAAPAPDLGKLLEVERTLADVIRRKEGEA